LYENYCGFIGTWTPQGQFIQQIPTHQLEELRAYPQYGVTSYHQAAPGINKTGFTVGIHLKKKS
jgi:hypothetical protein